MEAADTVGPVNILLHRLFSQVEFSLSGTLITNSSNTYPYRAYLENLLSYRPAAKSSQLTSELFYKDEAGKMDKPNPLEANADERNTGLARRAGFIARSREVDLVGRIHTDIFFQNRYMLNEVNTKIKLTRSKDNYCLMAIGGQAFKVKIAGAAFLSRKVKISVPSSCQDFGKWDGGISYSPSLVQDVHGTCRILGRQSRKVVWRTTPNTIDSRLRGQSSF